MGQVPPAPLRTSAERQLGAGGAWVLVVSHPRGDVWRYTAAAPDEASVWVKVHRGARAYAQELGAYRSWLPHHPGRHPELLGHVDRALLLSDVGGAPTDGRTAEAQRLAGAWLAALHAVPHRDDDPLPPRAAWERRIDAALRRAAPLLSTAALDAIGARLRAVDLAGCARVPCHRDFGPHNWRLDPRAGLAVIDFEHTTADFALVDLVQLRLQLWPGRPDLEAAFFEGYGGPLSALDARRLEGWALLHALNTRVWGVEHRDDTFAELGGRWLAGLGLAVT